MSVLDDTKILLGSTEDAVIQIYINRGKTLIRNYLNMKDTDTTDIELTYPDAVICYVIESYRKRGLEGTKQFSQGSRSGTLTDGLSNEVKSLLPKPYIRLMG